MLCRENTSTLMTTESQIAAPPSMAVGFLCQRSILGTATKPRRGAKARTKGVSTSAKQNDAATARSVRGLKGMSVWHCRAGLKDFQLAIAHCRFVLGMHGPQRLSANCQLAIGNRQFDYPARLRPS